MSRRKSSPKAIGEVLAQLFTQRGYGKVLTSKDFSAAWRQAITETFNEAICKLTRVGKLRRGTLEVIVAHSTLVQELTFRQQELVEKMKTLLPDEKITTIRFRTGPIQ